MLSSQLDEQKSSFSADEKSTPKQTTTARAYDMDGCLLQGKKREFGKYISYEDFVETNKTFLDEEVKAILEGGFTKAILVVFTARQSFALDFYGAHSNCSTFINIMFYAQRYYQEKLGDKVKVEVDLGLLADYLKKPKGEQGDSFKAISKDYHIEESQGYYIEPSYRSFRTMDMTYSLLGQEMKEHAPAILDIYKTLLFYNILHRICLSNENTHFAFVDDQYLMVLKYIKEFAELFSAFIPKCSIDFICYSTEPSLYLKKMHSAEGCGKADPHYAWHYRFMVMFLCIINGEFNSKTFISREEFLKIDVEKFCQLYNDYQFTSSNNFKEILKLEELKYFFEVVCPKLSVLEPCLTTPLRITANEMIQHNMVNERGFDPIFIKINDLGKLEKKFEKLFKFSKKPRDDHYRITFRLDKLVTFDSLKKAKDFDKLCKDHKLQNGSIQAHPEQPGKYFVHISEYGIHSLLKETKSESFNALASQYGKVEPNTTYFLIYPNVVQDLLRQAEIQYVNIKPKSQGFWQNKSEFCTLMLTKNELEKLNKWLDQNPLKENESQSKKTTQCLIS